MWPLAAQTTSAGFYVCGTVLLTEVVHGVEEAAMVASRDLRDVKVDSQYLEDAMELEGGQCYSVHGLAGAWFLSVQVSVLGNARVGAGGAGDGTGVGARR